MTNSSNTTKETPRPARDGRARALGFRHAVYATCNPAWHAHQRRLQRYNQGRRRGFSADEARRIEQLHRSGQTLKQIGEALRIHLRVIRRELRGHGIVLTKHKFALPPRQRFSLLDAEVEQIQAMQKQGRTMSYIAEEICVCVDVIRRELRARGLPTRPDRGRRVKKSMSGWWGTLGDDPDAYKKIED
jgi:hypothetical protein